MIFVLGECACPVAETARIADYFTNQSAGQCGPCVYGLGAIADTIHATVTGTATAEGRRKLDRWMSEIPGRGACQYPDGAVRFLSSALRVFADEFREHARSGPCARCAHSAVLPAPVAVFDHAAA